MLNRGYRAGGDYKRCLQAAFEMHSETLNAWVSGVSAGRLPVAPTTAPALAVVICT